MYGWNLAIRRDPVDEKKEKKKEKERMFPRSFRDTGIDTEQ